MIGGPHPVSEVANLVDADGNIGDEVTLRMLAEVVNELTEAAGLPSTPEGPV